MWRDWQPAKAKTLTLREFHQQKRQQHERCAWRSFPSTGKNVAPFPGAGGDLLVNGETEEAARERAIVEHGVKPSYGGFLFCNKLDAALWMPFIAPQSCRKHVPRDPGTPRWR